MTAPAGGLVDDDEDDDELFDELPSEQPAPAAGGPVMLTLTTRAQIEKAETTPKMIRVRPGRGAFGGTAGGPGCARH